MSSSNRSNLRLRIVSYRVALRTEEQHQRLLVAKRDLARGVPTDSCLGALTCMLDSMRFGNALKVFNTEQDTRIINELRKADHPEVQHLAIRLWNRGIEHLTHVLEVPAESTDEQRSNLKKLFREPQSWATRRVPLESSDMQERGWFPWENLTEGEGALLGEELFEGRAVPWVGFTNSPKLDSVIGFLRSVGGVKGAFVSLKTLRNVEVQRALSRRVTRLRVVGTSMPEPDACRLVNAVLDTTHAETLDLSGVVLGTREAAEWRTLFQSLTELQALRVNRKVHEAGADILAQSLPHMKALQAIQIVGASADYVATRRMVGALGDLASLRRVALMDYLSSDATRADVPEALRSLTQLQELSLRGSVLGEKGCEAIARVLPSLTALAELDLRSCAIFEAGAVQIAGAIRGLTSLQRVSFGGGNWPAAPGMAALADAFAATGALRMLDLSNSRITDKGGEALFSALPSLPALEQLNLRSTGLTGSATALSPEAFAGLQKLTMLDVGCNTLGSVAASQLARGLPLLTSLQRLDISGNLIDVEGAATLAEALPKLHGLIELAVGGNKLGAPGTTLLAASLSSLTALEVLHMHMNHCQLEGMLALSPALATMPALRVLELGGNDFGEIGGVVLAATLPYLPALESLNLAGNAIGDYGVMALARRLPALSRLASLSVRRNELALPGVREVVKAAAGMKAMSLLDVGDDVSVRAVREEIAIPSGLWVL
jgi:Ran GTPase-activating protein (RanGAP) involved in mRNA processing and transport